MRPRLVLRFNGPRSGYWDGGKRSGGEFTPEVCGNILMEDHPGKNQTIRWGCFDLNFWFNCGSGRSWKEAAGIAKKRLAYMTIVPSTIETLWTEQ